MKDREDFIIYACELMRNRLAGGEVARAMGWNEEEVIKVIMESASGQMFRSMLFMRIVPNLRKLGLITPRVREAFERLDIIKFEDFDTRSEEHTSELQSH